MVERIRLQTPYRIIRGWKTLHDHTGFSRSQLLEMIADGRFPRPLRLGPRSVGWLESEILAWQLERIRERDEADDADADDGEAL